MNQTPDRKNSNTQIRNARADEFDAAGLLLKRSFMQYATQVAPEIWDSYLEDVMDVRSRINDSDLIVAESNGQLVGSVTLYLDASRSTEEGWPAGWAGIRLLAVDPAQRHQGIGHALMQECVRRSRARGIRTIGLHTSMVMEVARRMYERMGFVRVPEYDFSPIPGVTVMAYRLDV